MQFSILSSPPRVFAPFPRPGEGVMGEKRWGGKRRTGAGPENCMALLLLLSGFCFFFRFPGPGMVPDARGITTPDGTGRNPPCAGVAAFGLCRGRYAHADTACLNSIAWGHNPRLSLLAA